LNQEVVIVFGTAARYRRVSVGNSHDDAQPDKSALQTVAVRPGTVFVERLLFMLPLTGHGSSKVLEMLPAFSLVMLASSTSSDKKLCVIVRLCRPPPNQDCGRARTVVDRFARDDKELGPQLGKQLPGELPRETAET
jgi:hypothetical protein